MCMCHVSILCKDVAEWAVHVSQRSSKRCHPSSTWGVGIIKKHLSGTVQQALVQSDRVVFLKDCLHYDKAQKNAGRLGGIEDENASSAKLLKFIHYSGIPCVPLQGAVGEFLSRARTFTMLLLQLKIRSAPVDNEAGHAHSEWAKHYINGPRCDARHKPPSTHGGHALRSLNFALCLKYSTQSKIFTHLQ